MNQNETFPFELWRKECWIASKGLSHVGGFFLIFFFFNSVVVFGSCFVYFVSFFREGAVESRLEMLQ
jgi:hypothetical protein